MKNWHLNVIKIFKQHFSINRSTTPTTADNRIRFHSCQPKTRIWGYRMHRLTETGQNEDQKTKDQANNFFQIISWWVCAYDSFWFSFSLTGALPKRGKVLTRAKTNNSTSMPIILEQDVQSSSVHILLAI